MEKTLTRSTTNLFCTRPARSLRRLSGAALLSCLAALAGCESASPTEPIVPTAPTMPDLVITAASISTATVPSSGGTISYCLTFQNAGAAVEGNSEFDIAAFFSTDTTLDASDPHWGGGYSGSLYHLSAGFTREFCTTGSLGKSTPPAGSYYVIFKIDAFPNQGPNFFAGVAESNEDNNWRATTTRITIQP